MLINRTKYFLSEIWRLTDVRKSSNNRDLVDLYEEKDFEHHNIRKIFAMKKDALIYAIFIATLTSTIFFGSTLISIAYWVKGYQVGIFYTTNFHYTAYIEDDRDKAAKEIVKKIPSDAKVSAEQHFLPLLFKKKKI